MTMVVESVAGRGSYDHVFFTGMSFLALLTVLAGFAPTYYLRGPDLPSLPVTVQLHGIVFTAWFLLFVTQTALVAAHRTDIHRRLGLVAVGVAGLVVVLGTAVAIGALRQGFGPAFGMEPSTFFSIPMGDILAFAILVSAAVVLRRKADAHKRLMLLATVTLLPAAFARLQIPLGGAWHGRCLSFAISSSPCACSTIFGRVGVCIPRSSLAVSCSPLANLSCGWQAVPLFGSP